jgi:peptidoglycan hydrolase-like protein with peptidoglycan-binding domain
MNSKLEILSNWLSINDLKKESLMVASLFKYAAPCNPPFSENLLDSIKSGGTLSINAKGTEVGYMQTMLEDRGYKLTEHGVDCLFGPETKSELSRFQRDNQLSGTGILNNETLALLQGGIDISETLSRGSRRGPEATDAELEATVSELDVKYSEWSTLGGPKASGVNFHIIEDGKNNFRSAIPEQSIEFFQYLKIKHGIQNIINLKSEGGQRQYVEGAKLHYETIPLGSSSPSESEWVTIKALLNKGNTLVHCRHGADRTGLVVARWKVERGDLNTRDAYKEALSYGFKKPDHEGYPDYRCGHLPETTEEEVAAMRECVEDAKDPNEKLRDAIFASRLVTESETV